MGGKSSSAVRYPWLTRRSLVLIRPVPEQDLLLCAKHLFVAATVAEVHAGCRDRQVRMMAEGQSAFEAVTLLWAAKAAPPSVTLG